MCFLNVLKSKAYFFKGNQSHDNLNCAKVLLLLIVSVVLLLLMPTTNTHLSRFYSAEILNVSRLIQCLDRFSVENNNTFHIAFIGDSRIRQLFSRFAEVNYCSRIKLYVFLKFGYAEYPKVRPSWRTICRFQLGPSHLPQKHYHSKQLAESCVFFSLAKFATR